MRLEWARLTKLDRGRPEFVAGRLRGRHGGRRAKLSPQTDREPGEPLPLAERSRVGALIASASSARWWRSFRPRASTVAGIEGAALLHRLGVHAINVPDSPRASARMSAQSLCIQIQQKVGIETVLHYTCRDRNLLSIQST